MASTRSLMILYTVVGVSVALSPKAFRNLNNKINLLKTTFKRDLSLQQMTFQHKIGEMKFEMMDLKAELDIEKARASRLETILNGTDFDEDSTDNAVKTSKHEQQEKSMSPTERGIIEQHSRDIRQFRDSIARHDVAIADNKNAIDIAQDMQQNMSVYERLYKAFQDEKKHKTLALKEIQPESEETKQIIADIRQRVNGMSSLIENNTETIAVLGNEITDQEQVFKEALDDASTKIRYQALNITILKATVDNILSGSYKIATSSTTFTTTLPPQTSMSYLQKQHEKCRQDIRAGGETMAKLLYVGVTVKRGEDWKWKNQDRGDYGFVNTIPEDYHTGKRKRVAVTWGSMSYGYWYRMGNGAYDVAIVEEKFDFSHCK